MNYEIITSEFGDSIIKATDENGLIKFIPMADDNSDYQAYLKSLEKPTAKK